MGEATIRQVRLRVGLTQGALAKLTGVSRQTVNKWEGGQKAEQRKIAPFLRKLEDLARSHMVLDKGETIGKPVVRVRGWEGRQ